MRLILLTVILSSLCSMSCGYLITTETHLIPSWTKGDVFIIQNNRNGVELRREWGAKVYQIPDSRILITSEPRAQFYRRSWYYVLDDGTREQLEYQDFSVNDTPENRADERPFVWFETDNVGGIGVPCTIKWRQYYVGTRASLIARGVKGSNDEELAFREFINNNASTFCE
jgi:hypothetical protein